MAGPTPATSGRIFICYRRQDTDFPAGWLHDRLVGHFGRDRIVKDVHSEVGEDFAEVIANAVGSCEVLLALIGDQWLTVTDEHGRRRLENPDDFVRLEIEAALQRDVRVIPILFERATMPRADELPSSLGRMARRQPLELSPSRFDFDTSRLRTVLDRVLADAQAKREADAQATQPRKPRIFVSYRRDDSRWLAGRLFDRLGIEYGGNQVFRDVDTAKPGVRFDQRIRSALDQCDVLLAVIGDAWLSATDSKGRQRLELPNDLVRLEVSVALERGIPIIPVLVQRTPMPTQEDLPDSISDLAFYDACRIEDERWDSDIRLLITSINELAGLESHGSNAQDRDTV